MPGSASHRCTLLHVRSVWPAHGFIEVGDDYLNPERVHRLILMAPPLVAVSSQSH
jgi:hypothetical protein